MKFPSITLVSTVALLGIARTPAQAQDRSIYSLLDTGGRQVSAPSSTDGTLSPDDVLSDSGRRVQVWSLEAPTGSSIQIDLRSADFDAFLYAVGPGLHEGLWDDDGGDGLNSRLCLRIDEAGDYRIVASALEGSTGRFTLQLSEAASPVNGACPASSGSAGTVTDLAELPTDGRTLEAGSTVEGILGDGDPMMYESPVQAWQVAGRAGRPFSVDLVSDAFDAYLFAAGPGLESWLQDDDGAGRCDSRLTFDFPQTGTYRVVVSTLDNSGGPFRLVASEEPGPASDGACVHSSNADAPDESEAGDVEDLPTVGSLAYGTVSDGTMSGDETLYAGRFVQAWTLAGSAGDRVAIDLRSGDFDSYLFFGGPGFPEAIYDDDGGGGLHSRICVELPEDGTYRVLAGALSGRQDGGRFTLGATLEGAGSPCLRYDLAPAAVTGVLSSLSAEGRSIAVGEETTGTLDVGSARHPETNQRLQAWDLQVRPEQTVFVDVESTEFDPLLYAVGGGIDGTLFVDDAGDGCNTRMQIGPGLSGSVTLLVGAYVEDATGGFTLRASENPPMLASGGCITAEDQPTGSITSDPSTLVALDSGADRPLALGTEVTGSLGELDQTLPSGNPAQAWSIEVQQGQSYVFEVLSDDFDPVLYLDGPGVFAPIVNDDGLPNQDSRIELDAPESGRMRLVVSAFGEGGAGSFRLRALRVVR